MPGSGRVALALLAGAVACGGEEGASGPPARPEPAPPPAARVADADPVAEEFRAVCRAFRESDERYYGERPARRLEARVERALAAPRATPRGLERQVLALATEWLEQGRPEDALALLARAGSPGSGPLAGRSERAAPAIDGPAWSGADASSAASPRLRRLTLSRDAHLQAGEDRNCLQSHAAERCILPFREGALHTDPAHARRAAELSLEILALQPDLVSARWLANLMRMVTNDYPAGVPPELRLPKDAFASEEGFPRWRDRAHALGVAAVDLAGGAVLDDFDGDGRLDLVSSTADPCDSLKAFRADGAGGFEDVTAAWGLDAQLGGLNLVHGDFDGDGRLDLLVLRGAWLRERGRVRNSLLRNEPGPDGPRFADVTRRAGLAEPAYPTQTAAFADYDGDGDLDLYVGNEAWQERPYRSQLFRNEGGGVFTDVAAEAGVADPGFAKGVAWGDYDDDGDPDLYVSCIGPNRLYRNEGDGRFREVAAEQGVAEPAGRSFATWFFDLDNDGRLDLFVADYGATPAAVMASYFAPGSAAASGHPLVYRNTGEGFVEISQSLGLTRPLLPMGANHGDVDGDGWPDLYLGTGNPDLASLVPNALYRNRGGARFADVSFASGTAHLQKGHGVAFGDVDGDGDQDLFHQLGGFFPGDAYGNALFENPGTGRRWITLRLEGRRANRFGVGARIAVRVREPGGVRTIHALAGSGGSFGGSSLQQEIGLGDATAIDAIRIRWPGSGTEQVFRNVAPDAVYRAVEGEGVLDRIATPPMPLRGGSGRHAH